MTVDKNIRVNQVLTAVLQKPNNFQGSPIFADDRAINPITNPECQIRPDSKDESGLTYRLFVTDLDKCGVLIKNVSPMVSRDRTFFSTTKYGIYL